jgi:hypothetical protein
MKKPEERPTVDMALRGNFFVVGIGEVAKRDKRIKELEDDIERLKRDKEVIKKDNGRLKGEKEDALKGREREKKAKEEVIRDEERIMNERQEKVEMLKTQLEVKTSYISSYPTTGSSVTEKKEDVLYKGERIRFELPIIIPLFTVYLIANVMQQRNLSDRIINTIITYLIDSFTSNRFHLLGTFFRSFIAIFVILVDLHFESSAFPVFVDVYTYTFICSPSISFESYSYVIWLI